MVRAAVIRKHREMATSSACTTSTEPSPGLWTVEQLKIYLKEKEIPVSGSKERACEESRRLSGGGSIASRARSCSVPKPGRYFMYRSRNIK